MAIKVKERKMTTLSGFRGVDANEVKGIDLTRASKMRNVMRRDGVNHKRWGWADVGVPTINKPLRYLFNFNTKIDCDNGLIFMFYDDAIFVYYTYEGTEYYGQIGFVDGDDFKVYKEGLITDYIVLEDVIRDEVPMNPFAIQMGTDSVFFIFGHGLRFRVDGINPHNGFTALWEDAYVPTTTMSVTGILYGSDDEISAVSGELPNYFTEWRINTAIGINVVKNSGNQCVIRLDGTALLLDDAIQIKWYGANGWCGGKLDITGGVYSIHEWNMTVDGEFSSEVTPAESIGSLNTYEGHTYLYMTMMDAPVIAQESNVQVKFMVEQSLPFEYTPNIGTVFGINGKEDQLFLGRTDSSFVMWSAVDNITYFPVGWYSNAGANNAPVVGFGRLADETLAIFKEPNGDESGIYFCTGKWEKASWTRQDPTLSDTMLDPYFSFQAGGYGEGALSAQTIKNFNGEVMYLTNKGVYSVYIPSSATTLTRRYSSERSRSINKLLAKEDLSTANAVMWQGKYILLFPSGNAYVAEPFDRYKPKSSDYYQYEWYVWDNIPATCACIMGDELYFGTADGFLRKFVKDTYKDVGKVCIESGEMTYDPSTDTITVSQDIFDQLQEGDKLRVRHGAAFNDLYYRVTDFTMESGYYEDFPIDEDNVELVQDGLPVWWRKKGSTSALTTMAYTELHRAEGYFKLSDGDGGYYGFVCVPTFPATTQTDELLAHCPYEFYIHDLDADTCSFKIRLGSASTENLDLVTRDGQAQVIINEGYIIRDTPVPFEWVTGAINNGTSASTKTMLGLAIDCDGAQGCNATFGYECRAISRGNIDVWGTGGFDFENFDFLEFAFETNGATSYTKVFNERNYNYIMFSVKSSGDSDFILHAITEKFKYNNYTKGVR